MCYLRERVDDIERDGEDLHEKINQINSLECAGVDFDSGDVTSTDHEYIPLLSRSWPSKSASYSQTHPLKRKCPTNKQKIVASKIPLASTSRQFSLHEAPHASTTNISSSSTTNISSSKNIHQPNLLRRHTQFTFDETDLRHELDTWKKAHNSLQGITRDEKTVQKVLRRKVMALDSLLHR